MRLLSIASILAFTAACSSPPTPQQPSPIRATGIATPLLAAHNRERAAFGSPPLAWDPALAAAAQDYARQLAGIGRLQHSPRSARPGARARICGSGRAALIRWRRWSAPGRARSAISNPAASPRTAAPVVGPTLAISPRLCGRIAAGWAAESPARRGGMCWCAATRRRAMSTGCCSAAVELWEWGGGDNECPRR